MTVKRIFIHIALGSFIIMLFAPLYLALVAASHDGVSMMQAELPVWPGSFLVQNLKTVLKKRPIYIHSS